MKEVNSDSFVFQQNSGKDTAVLLEKEERKCYATLQQPY